MRNAGWIAALFAVAGAAGASPATHDGLHEQIAALTREIEGRPRDARLHLRRAELCRLHRQWDAALADLARAQALDPRLDGLRLCGARVFRDAGVPGSALRLLEEHLALRPGDPEALLLRAELALRRGAVEEALRDLDRTITSAEPAEPDLYLARAELLAALGPAGVERALDGLDEGLARLGPVVALARRALELELERGRVDHALARLDEILARSPRPETWLAQRGEILLEVGRVREARDAFLEARVALESLTLSRRSTAAMHELQAALECRLAELGARVTEPSEGGTTREEPDSRSHPQQERFP